MGISGGYAPPAFNALVAKSQITVDPAERQNLINQLSMMLYNEGPYVVWGYANNLDAAVPTFAGWGAEPVAAAVRQGIPRMSGPARPRGPVERAAQSATSVTARRLRGLSFALAVPPRLVAVLVAVIGPWVMPHSPAETIGPAYHGPAPGYSLGTDYLGRDVLSRILDGGHDLLVLPLIATAVATTVGVLIGITIGYLGGRLDSTIMRLIDVLLAIPALLVLLVIVSGFGGGRTTLVIAVALTG